MAVLAVAARHADLAVGAAAGRADGPAAVDARAAHAQPRQGASRVIHLTMADNERKASSSADLDWDQFIGVQERLQLASIARIETEAGEGIMSVEDLMRTTSSSPTLLRRRTRLVALR